MAVKMTEVDIMTQEKRNTGTSRTYNDQFEKDGYLVVKDLWDPEELYHPCPKDRGQLNYWGTSLDQFTHTQVEQQVEGSLARYWHPQYRVIHSKIRKKLEKILGRDLYNTYYYDRYYFPGQELTKHADRDACEISVTVHISTNLPDNLKDWPVKIKTPDTYVDKQKSAVLVPGEERTCILNPGDGMIYKGCERPHWRDPMPGLKVGEKEKGWFAKEQTEQLYYHQIFYHYVLQDGFRAQCAWDRSR